MIMVDRDSSQNATTKETITRVMNPSRSRCKQLVYPSQPPNALSQPPRYTLSNQSNSTTNTMREEKK
ncbi:hypothetical protein VTJ04DRAFT_3686 [Mycothermus thermophilus]|uniref:uncharacterized protein n=1 Tax=Humicola insolens TaxID=85995 RepID=UPI0037435911